MILKKVEHSLGLVLLVLFIILSLSELLELSVDLNYVTKILLWSTFGYLFYRASPTYVFFGQRHRGYDAWIILSYFLLILKDLITYISLDIDKNPLFPDFYHFVIDHALQIELWGLYIGGAGLLILSALLTSVHSYVTPSLAALFVEKKRSWFVRFLLHFLFLISFFVIIFNLGVQWLGASVFSYIMAVSLLVYHELHKHHRKFDPSHSIHQLGTAGESFYTKCIQLFHDKKTLGLALLGILALHFVTDLGSFLIPYTANLVGFLEGYGPGHESLYHLFFEEHPQSMIEELVVVVSYAASLFGLLMLMLGPIVLWYALFSHQKVTIHRTVIAFFFSCLILFILYPVFSLTAFDGGNFVGVDVQTSALSSYSWTVLALFGLVFVLFYVFSHWFPLLVQRSLLFTILFFVGYYVYLYVKSVVGYYLSSFQVLWILQEYVVLAYLGLFFGITLLFYVSSYSLFLYDLWKKKWSLSLL